MLRQEGGKERADHMRALPCLRWTTPVTLPARPGPRAARVFHFRVDLARLTASLRDLTVGAPSSSLLLEKLPELDPKSLRNVHGGRSRSTGSGKPRRYRCGAFSCRCRMPADTLPVLLLSYLGERNIASFSTDIDSFDFKMRRPEQVVQSVMTNPAKARQRHRFDA